LQLLVMADAAPPSWTAAAEVDKQAARGSRIKR